MNDGFKLPAAARVHTHSVAADVFTAIGGTERLSGGQGVAFNVESESTRGTSGEGAGPFPFANLSLWRVRGSGGTLSQTGGSPPPSPFRKDSNHINWLLGGGDGKP